MEYGLMPRPDLPEVGRFYKRRPTLLLEEAVLYGPEAQWRESQKYQEYLKRQEPDDGITVIKNDYSGFEYQGNDTE